MIISLADFITIEAAVPGKDPLQNPKQYNNHTNTQLLQVLSDGKDLKLTVLQKYAVKKAQIEAAADEAAVNAIVW